LRSLLSDVPTTGLGSARPARTGVVSRHVSPFAEQLVAEFFERVEVHKSAFAEVDGFNLVYDRGVKMRSATAEVLARLADGDEARPDEALAACYCAPLGAIEPSGLGSN